MSLQEYTSPVIEVENEDEIDLKELIEVLKRYKLSIAVITLLVTVAAFLFQYVRPDIYRAVSTIELPQEQKGFSPQGGDILADVMSLGGQNIENEIGILQSNYLVTRALEQLDNFAIRYYKKEGIVTTELYRDTPFVVTIDNTTADLVDVKFHIIPVNQTQFHLTVDTRSNWIVRLFRKLFPSDHSNEIYVDEDFSYGTKITTPWFTLKVDKIRSFDPDGNYFFKVFNTAKLVEMIKENLSVHAQSKQSSIIEVSYDDNIRHRAVDYVAALVDAYLRQELEYKTQNADEALKFIDAQLQQIQQVLAASGQRLENFKSQNTLVNLSEKASMTATSLSDYQSKLRELEIEENILKNLLYYVKNNKNIEGLTLGSVQMTDPALSKSIEKLQETILRRKTLLVSFTELHPEVVTLTQQINSLRKNILFLLKNDISSIRNRKKELQKIISDYKKSLQQMPKQEQKLANLAADYEVNQKIYAYLLEKRTEVEISKAYQTSTARVIDRSDAGEEPVKPKRLLIIIVGFIAGLILGIMVAFFRYFLKDTVETEADVEHVTTIPVYGAIPYLRSKKIRNLFMEALRTLRTNIEFTTGANRHNLLVISSTLPGEGKTTVSKALSIILAKTGKKVITIDADMRKPRLSAEFGITAPKIGLSTYLAGKDDLSDVIVPMKEEEVDLLPAGTIPPNPSELLASTQMEKLIEKLMEEYDYVIIDTPPVGLVTDGFLLMKQATLSLLVTRVGRTKKIALKHFDKYVRKHHIENVGIVLNGMKVGGGGYYGGYGYGYGGYGYGSTGSKAAQEYYTNHSV